MKRINTKNLALPIFSIFILFLGIQAFNFYFYINSFGGHEWHTAEWLIHYSYGFIRRGMFGTLVYNLPFNPDTSLIFLTYILHSFYILYLSCILLIFIKNRQNNLSYLVLFSPAFIFFHISNLEAIFRKELLGLLALSLVVLSYSFKSKNIVFLFALFIYIVGIFSAEYNLYFLLPIIYILFKKKDINKTSKSLALAFPSFLYFFFYLRHINQTKEIPKLICESLYKFNYYESFCSGAIKWLNYDINQTLALTIEYYKSSAYSVYFFYFLVSIAPFFFTNFFSKNVILLLFFTASYIPLFIISIDWGRHIYMYISTLTILFFSESNKKHNLKSIYQKIFFYIFIFLNMPYFAGSYKGLLSFKNLSLKFSFLFDTDTFSYFLENYVSGLLYLFKAITNYVS